MHVEYMRRTKPFEETILNTDIQNNRWNQRFLELLAEHFPTRQSAYTEIINLKAILNLPKGTEHFMSDLHGEYEAFEHILNNCSGVIRERVDATFGDELSASERDDLCTLIYYPREKLARLHAEGIATGQWYYDTLFRIVRLARYLSGFYTRSKVRKAMPVAYAYIIDELLHASGVGEQARHDYHVRIISSIVEEGAADDFIESLSSLVKRLAVDHMHIVGDIFDRGPHADRILDRLMSYHSLDIQWGNHDVCWMGAAAGSEACVASVVRNNVRYGSYALLEGTYGISLRKLALFAERTYGKDDGRDPVDKAISVILFKLEGHIIGRHPEFAMEDRLSLGAMRIREGTVQIDGRLLTLKTQDFPTVDPKDPYALTKDEQEVLDDLVTSFRESTRLRRHVEFLYQHGSIYLLYNGNLLFHGCIPLNEDGSFASVNCGKAGYLSGKQYLDFCDKIARQAWLNDDRNALDWMWYLWCGRRSTLSGRLVKTFERAFVCELDSWVEPQDPYYRLLDAPEVVNAILEEFGLDSKHGHIVNGHTPVRLGSGETPVHAGGKLLVIDGGFCSAYHERTGIAGFTLVTSSTGMRIKAHRPFLGVGAALDRNADIQSNTRILETEPWPLKIADTDTGNQIRSQIDELEQLLEAYRDGTIAEHSN